MKLPLKMQKKIYASTLLIFIISGFYYCAHASMINLTDVQNPFAGAIISQVETKDNSVSLQFSLEQIKVEDKVGKDKNYKLLSVGKEGFSNELGKPKVPMIKRLIQIPPNATDLTIEVIPQGSPQELSGYEIYPAPKQVVEINEKGCKYIAEEFYKDESTYKIDDYYPGLDSLCLLGKEGKIREVRVVPIHIYPVQFNPARKSLKIYNRLKIVVSYSLSRAKSSPPIIKESETFKKLYKSTILNYQERE